MPQRHLDGPSALGETAVRSSGDAASDPDADLIFGVLNTLDAALQTLAAAPTLPPDATAPLTQALAAATELGRLLRPPPTLPPDGMDQPAPVLVVGLLRVDTITRQVTLAEQPVRLTPTEYRIVHQLALTPGRTVTRERLLTQVWGPAYVESTDYLWVHLSRLRQKLRLPGQPSLIVTERGLGYRLRIPRR